MAIAGSLGEIRGWSRRWMPWLQEEAVLIEAEALRTKMESGRRGERLLPADAIGSLLMVRHSEREHLGLTTIGCCDLSKEQRQKLANEKKRQRDRERQRAKRQTAARVDREVYVAKSAEAIRPWEAAGISRRTWYRRKGGTGSSRAMYIDIGGDTPVPSLPSKQTASPEGEGTGFGDKSPAEFQEAEPHGANCRSACHG